LSDIDVIGSSSKVDANLISPSHIDEILSFLIQRFNIDSVFQDAYFLLCFCFFSGLRRNEAAKLRWGDFTFGLVTPAEGTFDYVLLSLKPNKDRTLKTASARRILPLDALWPKTAIRELRSKYQRHQNSNAKKYAPLFTDDTQVNQAYDLITKLIRHYTQDFSLRVHHLRHSFANWTWCRFNPHLVQQGKRQIILFEHEIFSYEYLQHLQQRLCYRNITRKMMFILSHLMGHKDVQSTLNSYLHLKDILHYLELMPRFQLKQKFINECVERMTLTEPEQGVTLAERMKYYSLATEADLAIKPSPLTPSLTMPTLSTVVINERPKIDISSLTWARALAALRTQSVAESARTFDVPKELLQQLLDNAEQVHQQYPRVGKHLPLIPNFPTLNDVKGSNQSKSSEVFCYLCGMLDKKIETGMLKLDDINLSIITYAIPGKNYALRCPDLDISKNFMAFCQLFELKPRHLRFKYYPADLEAAESLAAKNWWVKTIESYGFSDTYFVIAKPTEGRFLGKHDGKGFIEIALVNNKYKRVQRHRSIFSFLHFLLILTTRVERADGEAR
ncbi:MAG: tyrosine-type recombinase/integrase, partial [Shewanella sp.]